MRQTGLYSGIFIKFEYDESKDVTYNKVTGTSVFGYSINLLNLTIALKTHRDIGFFQKYNFLKVIVPMNWCTIKNRTCDDNMLDLSIY